MADSDDDDWGEWEPSEAELAEIHKGRGKSGDLLWGVVAGVVLTWIYFDSKRRGA